MALATSVGYPNVGCRRRLSDLRRLDGPETRSEYSRSVTNTVEFHGGAAVEKSSMLVVRVSKHIITQAGRKGGKD